jgi:radical SAM protein with 4Fe4S-binding SPASM domain
LQTALRVTGLIFYLALSFHRTDKANFMDILWIGDFMFYRQKYDTFIRVWDDTGYIVNKKDFSDRVTDASGAVFLNALSRKPKELSELAREIQKSFNGVDLDEIKNDAAAFYQEFVDAGFIVCGNTIDELDKQDKGFSYASIKPEEAIIDYNPENKKSKKRDSREYLENYFKDKPQLMSMQIELSSRCNERCIHCYIPHDKKINDIDAALFYDILEQCKDMRVLNFTMSGGEPMIHKNFYRFLQKAKDYDFCLTVLSNLTLLNDEIIYELKNNKLSNVQVSLYSMDPDIHDSITKMEGSFKKTMRGIEKLLENDIPLQISCPLMKQNKDSYFDVLKWAQEHKCRSRTDYIMMARYDRSTSNLDNRLSLEETGKIIDTIIENDKSYQRALLSPEFAALEQRDAGNAIVCGVGISSICMASNGNIYPCPGWQSYVCENARNETLKNIWEKSPQIQFLRNLRQKDFPKCIVCKDFNFCSMCMVRNANESSTGDPFAINEHFCKVAALNHSKAMRWKEKQ